MHDQSTVLDASLAALAEQDPEPPFCIVWKGARTNGGYGVTGGKRAHRLAYELAYGPIAPGLHVIHRCDNPPCIRPEHLWAGTNRDNVRDKVSKGRARWRDERRAAMKQRRDEAWSAGRWRKGAARRWTLVEQAGTPSARTPEEEALDSLA